MVKVKSVITKCGDRSSKCYIKIRGRDIGSIHYSTFLKKIYNYKKLKKSVNFYKMTIYKYFIILLNKNNKNINYKK